MFALRVRPLAETPPRAGRPPARVRRRPVARPPEIADPVTVTAARRLDRAAGMLAASVLFDSAMEHARGNFHNRAMWTPIVTSALSLGVSLHGLRDRRRGAHPVRDVVQAGAGAVGLIGTGFHLYNATKKVGGLSWQNLFYSAPPGAPAALTLSGLMGYLAERVRDNAAEGDPAIHGQPAGRMLAGTTALSLLGTSAEAGFLHFRGAFHNPAMLLPVTLPPAAAGALACAALGPPRGRRGSRLLLGATAAMGVAGSLFHVHGVSRGMGGWRNWRQNALAGPPVPAPPSFTGLALAGLAALSLIGEERRRD